GAGAGRVAEGDLVAGGYTARRCCWRTLLPEQRHTADREDKNGSSGSHQRVRAEHIPGISARAGRGQKSALLRCGHTAHAVTSPRARDAGMACAALVEMATTAPGRGHAFLQPLAAVMHGK